MSFAELGSQIEYLRLVRTLKLSRSTVAGCRLRYSVALQAGKVFPFVSHNIVYGIGWYGLTLWPFLIEKPDTSRIIIYKRADMFIVYVWICICIYIDINMCTHIHIYIYIHINIHIYIYTCIYYIYIHVNIYIYVSCIDMYRFVCVAVELIQVLLSWPLPED